MSTEPLNFEAVSKTVRAVGIKEWIVDDGIVDESTYKTKLREITGVGFKDCKVALEENGNDIEKSIEYLRF